MKIPSRKLATARLFAASRSDPRAYLHGVLFDYDHERIVSTDGRALHKADSSISTTALCVVSPDCCRCTAKLEQKNTATLSQSGRTTGTTKNSKAYN